MTKDDYRKFIEYKFEISCETDDNFTSFWNQFDTFFLPEEFFKNFLIFYISRNFLIFNVLKKIEITTKEIRNSFEFFKILFKEQNYKNITKNLMKKISEFQMDSKRSKRILETILSEIRIYYFIEKILNASFGKIEQKRNEFMLKKIKKFTFEKEIEILSKFESKDNQIPHFLLFECDKYFWKLERNISMRSYILEENTNLQIDDISDSLNYFFTKIGSNATLLESFSDIVCKFIASYFIDQNYSNFLDRLKTKLKYDEPLDQIKRKLKQKDVKLFHKLPNMTLDSIEPFIFEELVILISSFQLFTSNDSLMTDLLGRKSKIHYKDDILNNINAKLEESDLIDFLDNYYQIYNEMEKNFILFLKKEKKLRNEEILKKKYLNMDEIIPKWNENKSSDDGKTWVFIDNQWIEDDEKNEWKFDFFSQK